MANFTSTVSSITGLAGTSAGSDTITVTLTPDEGYILEADNINIPFFGVINPSGAIVVDNGRKAIDVTNGATGFSLADTGLAQGIQDFIDAATSEGDMVFVSEDEVANVMLVRNFYRIADFNVSDGTGNFDRVYDGSTGEVSVGIFRGVENPTNESFENIVKGEVQGDGTLSFTLDLIDSEVFSSRSISIDVTGDATPVGPFRVTGDLSFINNDSDDCVFFTLRDSEGNPIPDGVLPVDVSGGSGTIDDDTGDIEVLIVGQLDINPPEGQEFTVDTLSNPLTGVFSLIDETASENNGFTYNIGVTIPSSDMSLGSVSLEANDIALICQDIADVDCEIRSINVDYGVLDMVTGGLATVTAKGDPTAEATLTLTPSVTTGDTTGLTTPDAIDVNIIIDSDGSFTQIVQLPGVGGVDASGNACDPDVPSDLQLQWDYTITPATNCDFVGLEPDPIFQDEGTTVCFRIVAGTDSEDVLVLGSSMRGSSFEGGVITHTLEGATIDDDVSTDTSVEIVPDTDISLITGTDTGTEFCNGTITEVGSDVVIRIEYTEGFFQNENSKYLINLDRVIETGFNVSLNFTGGDNYSLSNTSFVYSGLTGNVVPGDIPTFIDLTANEGFTWQDVDLTAITTAFAADADSSTYIVSPPTYSPDDTSGDANIPILRINWTLQGTFTVDVGIDIDLSSIEPTAIVTTSFDIGDDMTGQSSLVDSTFMPIESITGVAGRSYSTEYFIVPDEGHVFNSASDASGERHSTSVPTPTVNASSVTGNPIEINGSDRYMMLRGTISGTHGTADETVLIDGTGGGARRRVNVRYTTTNNAQNTVVTGFDNVFEAVQGDTLPDASINISPSNTHEYLNPNSPSVTVDRGSHSGGAITGLGAVGEQDVTVNAIVGGTPTERPITYIIEYDTSGAIGIDSIPSESFNDGFPSSLSLVVNASTGYEFNSTNNIGFRVDGYGQGSNEPSLSSNNTAWSIDLANTQPTFAQPGDTLTRIITITNPSPLTTLVDLSVTGDTTFDAEGETNTYDVAVDPGDYTFEDGTGPFSITDDGSGMITAVATANTSPTSTRTDSFLVRSRDNPAVSRTINLVQESADVTLAVSENSLITGPLMTDAGASFTVTSNNTWSISGLNTSLFSASISGNTVTISNVSDNTSATTRTDDFQIVTDTIPDKAILREDITITQEAPTATVTINYVDTSFSNGTWEFSSRTTGAVSAGSSFTLGNTLEAATGFELDLESVSPSNTSYTLFDSADLGNVYQGGQANVQPASNTGEPVVSGIVPTGGLELWLNASGQAIQTTSLPEISKDSAAEIDLTLTSVRINTHVASLGNPPAHTGVLYFSGPGAGHIINSPSAIVFDIPLAVGTHETLITGLLPDTYYAYNSRFISDAGSGWAGFALAFKTPALTDPPPRMFTVNVLLVNNIGSNASISASRSSATGVAGQMFEVVVNVSPSSSSFELENVSVGTSGGGSNIISAFNGSSATIRITIPSADGTTARIAVSGNAVAVEVPEPLPRFDILSLTTVTPDVNGNGSSVQATWTGNRYVRTRTIIDDGEFDSVLYRTSLNLYQSTLGIDANSSTDSRMLNGTVEVTVPSSGYSNSGEVLTRNFQWLQPGVEPMPGLDIDNVSIAIVDNVQFGTVTPILLNNIEAGETASTTIRFDDGRGFSTLSAAVSAIQISSDGGLGEIGTLVPSLNTSTNRMMFSFEIDDDAVFTQSNYTVTISGTAGVIQVPLTETTVTAIATTANCSATTTSRNYDIGYGENPFARFTPADGFEFTSTSDLTVGAPSNTSSFITDFPGFTTIGSVRLGPHNIGQSGEIADGDIGVVLDPKNSGEFFTSNYTVNMAVTATPVETAVATIPATVMMREVREDVLFGGSADSQGRISTEVYNPWLNHPTFLRQFPISPNIRNSTTGLINEEGVTLEIIIGYVEDGEPDVEMLPCQVGWSHTYSSNPDDYHRIQPNIPEEPFHFPGEENLLANQRMALDSDVTTFSRNHPVSDIITYDYVPTGGRSGYWQTITGRGFVQTVQLTRPNTPVTNWLPTQDLRLAQVGDAKGIEATYGAVYRNGYTIANTEDGVSGQPISINSSIDGTVRHTEWWNTRVGARIIWSNQHPVL